MKVGLRGVSVRPFAARAGARPALDGLSLDVESGERVAIIGPSGAGKTTLLNLAACAVRPSQGELLLDGANPWGLSARELHHLRGEFFLAPQVPPLPPRQRVVTAVIAGRLPRIGLWQALRSLFYPVGIAEADQALALFDIQDKLFARVDRLSGGERQRVGLARALLSQARLLLVDEPLAALDPSRAAQAIDTLTQAAANRRSTLITTLHDVSMALSHFPRIVGLREGRLFFDLPAAKVTPQMLADLYGGEEAAALPPAEPGDVGPRPVVMHCR